MRFRHPILAIGAGLALADASIVTLALPDLLTDFHTTVEGVAAVIGVYTFVLAIALLPAELVGRRHGYARVGAASFALFAAASILCAVAGSLGVLLVGRALQAVGGAGGLVAAFALLASGRRGPTAGHLWLGAAVLSAAIGPALGGALTEAFAWQAIFIAQAPIAAAGAIACWSEHRLGHDDAAVVDPGGSGWTRASARGLLRPASALGLVSAALSAVLFLLVLLLVAGWSISPLAAAAAVTILPAAALAGSRLPGPPTARATVGCALVGLGTLSLAFLPGPNVAWTLAPQAIAGLGMGLALPALGGDLLPERTPQEAAILLTIRHVGIAVALLILAPITSHRLNTATDKARERGVAVVLDAKLPPTDKLRLAPALLASVDTQDPRGLLQSAIADARSQVGADQRGAFDAMAARADDTLIDAVRESFLVAFLLTGAFALLGALILGLGGNPLPAWAVPLLLTGMLVTAGTAIAKKALAPEPVKIADPCKPRDLPSTGGIGGFLQDKALEVLDSAACRYGSSREELVLALADSKDAKRFQKKYGENPRSAAGILSLIF